MDTVSIADKLKERRAVLIRRAEEIAEEAVVQDRDLTAEESAEYDGLIAEAESLDRRAAEFIEGDRRARELDDSFRSVSGREPQRQGGGGDGPSAFEAWARKARLGDGFDVAPVRGAELRAAARARNVNVPETRAMSATGGTGPDGVYGTLWEYAIATSQILSAGAQVINTADGNSLPFPRATVHASTSDTPIAASGAIGASDATIGTVDSTVSKYGYLTAVPTELVQDVTFDLEGYIARAAGRELGRRIQKQASIAAVAGYTVAGSTGPTGTATSLGVQSTAGQGSDLLVDLFHSVLSDYRPNAAWTMADPTAAVVRKLKTSTGDPVWQPALVAGDPDLILGKGVYIDPFLPSPGASNKSIYFGDWSSLIVRIAGGIRFERSSEAGFSNDQVLFRALVRTGSVVLDPNAVKHFVHSAT